EDDGREKENEEKGSSGTLERACFKELFDSDLKNLREIDYTTEAFNAEKFSENFKRSDYVKFLTMEYFPGIKIDRIKQLDNLEVDWKRSSYLEQILSHGFFDADPSSFFIHVVSVQILGKDCSKHSMEFMKRILIIDEFGISACASSNGSNGSPCSKWRYDAHQLVIEQQSLQLRKKQMFATSGEDLLAIAADQPFQFPATFAFVVRVFPFLDGIGKVLILRLILQRLLRRCKQEMGKALPHFIICSANMTVEKPAEIIKRLGQGDLKLRVRTLESESISKSCFCTENNWMNTAGEAPTVTECGTRDLNPGRAQRSQRS
ncbi:hypothetical protein EJB05_25553, partial [Eragrostis curvula]